MMAKNSGSALILPGGKKGERLLKQYTKPRRDQRMNDEAPADVIARLEKRIESMDKRLKALEAREAQTWADLKRRERSGSDGT